MEFLLKYYKSIDTLPVTVFKKIVESNNYMLLVIRGKCKPAKMEAEFSRIYQDFLKKRQKNQQNYIRSLESESLYNVWTVNQINTVVKCLFYARDRVNIVNDLKDEILNLSINVNKTVLKYNLINKVVVPERDNFLIDTLNNLTGGRFRLNKNDKDFYEKLNRLKGHANLLLAKINSNKQLLENITNQKTVDDFDWGVFFQSITKWHGSIDINKMTLSDLADVLNLMEREQKEVKKLQDGKKSGRTI
jgi:hypothetical protein